MKIAINHLPKRPYAYLPSKSASLNVVCHDLVGSRLVSGYVEARSSITRRHSEIPF